MGTIQVKHGIEVLFHSRATKAELGRNIVNRFSSCVNVTCHSSLSPRPYVHNKHDRTVCIARTGFKTQEENRKHTTTAGRDGGVDSGVVICSVVSLKATALDDVASTFGGGTTIGAMADRRVHGMVGAASWEGGCNGTAAHRRTQREGEVPVCVVSEQQLGPSGR